MNSLPKKDYAVNIICSNVRGLGSFKKNNYCLSKIPYKIKEMVSSSIGGKKPGGKVPCRLMK